MSVACWELKAWVLAWFLTCSRFVVLDCFISQKQSIFLFLFSKDTMAWAFISQVAQFLFSVEKNNSEPGNKANRRAACPSNVTHGSRPTREDRVFCSALCLRLVQDPDMLTWRLLSCRDTNNFYLIEPMTPNVNSLLPC